MKFISDICNVQSCPNLTALSRVEWKLHTKPMQVRSGSIEQTVGQLCFQIQPLFGDHTRGCQHFCCWPTLSLDKQCLQDPLVQNQYCTNTRGHCWQWLCHLCQQRKANICYTGWTHSRAKLLPPLKTKSAKNNWSAFLVHPHFFPVLCTIHASKTKTYRVRTVYSRAEYSANMKKKHRLNYFVSETCRVVYYPKLITVSNVFSLTRVTYNVD